MSLDVALLNADGTTVKSTYDSAITLSGILTDTQIIESFTEEITFTNVDLTTSTDVVVVERTDDFITYTETITIVADGVTTTNTSTYTVPSIDGSTTFIAIGLTVAGTALMAYNTLYSYWWWTGFYLRMIEIQMIQNAGWGIIFWPWWMWA